MERKEYREGAKALLDLKKKEKREQGADVSTDGAQNDADKNNVEAAVLKYVAGTLDGNTVNPNNNSTNHNNGKKSNKRKKSFSNEEINDFQHWNAFLDTDQLHEDDKTDNPHSKSKKKKKQDVTVDPELAQLDDTTDHEQLVRAAILDANQLAQDAKINIQDYIQQPQDENDSKYSQLAHQALDNTIIQVAVAAQGREHSQHNNKDHDNQPKPIPGDASELIAAAATKASNWVETKQQGKMFSKREIEAIDRFINDYCQINSMTRKQICERVWSNERKKDDFWDLLHKVLPYRTRASVYKHIRRAYHVFEVRGKWSPEEDIILGKLAAEKDGQWKLIGAEMGRMPEDCRDRWRNYVKCGDNRASNKWSTDEEQKLKEIVSEIINEQARNITHASAINWTAVSEKMGGARSRIQCRYKWNKILKRDALARAQTIDINDRVWVLTKLQELRYLSEVEIDWGALAAMHPKNYWTGDDFKICYEKMRSNIRDHKKKTVVEICHILLQDLIQEANRSNVSIELPVVLQHFDRKQNDSAAIASAAINSTENDEDYVGWRSV